MSADLKPQIYDVDATNFEEEVVNASHERVIVVDFWAPWCGPCRQVGPIVEKLADEYAGQIKVGKLNVDENQKVAMKYRVMSIPTVILFRDGAPVEPPIIGAHPERVFRSRIEQYVGAKRQQAA